MDPLGQSSNNHGVGESRNVSESAVMNDQVTESCEHIPTQQSGAFFASFAKRFKGAVLKPPSRSVDQEELQGTPCMNCAKVLKQMEVARGKEISRLESENDDLRRELDSARQHNRHEQSSNIHGIGESRNFSDTVKNDQVTASYEHIRTGQQPGAFLASFAARFRGVFKQPSGSVDHHELQGRPCMNCVEAVKQTEIARGHMEISRLESEIDHLRGELNSARQQGKERYPDHNNAGLAEQRAERLQEQIKLLEREIANERVTSGSFPDSSATPVLLEGAFQKVQLELSDFTKEFMTVSGTINVSESGQWLDIPFSRKAHVKFGYQAYVSSIFFSGFELEDFGDENQRAKFPPPDQLPAAFFKEYKAFSKASDMPAEYREAFLSFCNQKFLRLFGKELDTIQESTKQSSGEPTETRQDGRLRDSFLRLAKSVWMLHKLTFSFEPCARVIRVGRNAAFDIEYMESIVSEDPEGDGEGPTEEEETPPRVTLVLLPGFRIHKFILKSRVYVIRL